MVVLSLGQKYCIFWFVGILFLISTCCVIGAEVVERNYLNSEYNAVVDSEEIRDDIQVKENKKRKNGYLKKNPLALDDSTFSGGDNNDLTFKKLLVRVTMILVFLVGILALVKIILIKGNRFGQLGGFMGNFAEKFIPNLTTYNLPNGLKLRQTLILAPGQNIYVIEVDGRRLLIGATHYGGVQFLADLTCGNQINTNDFKQLSQLNASQIEEYQNRLKGNNFSKIHATQLLERKMVKEHNDQNSLSPFFVTNENNNGSNLANIEGTKVLSLDDDVITNSQKLKNALKRKSNFRQSLLQDAETLEKLTNSK